MSSHTRVVAKAIVSRPDGKILLLRRSKTDTRRPLQWDIPGGAVEDDEDFTAGVARETEEESGIRIAPGEFHLAYATTAMTEFGNVCWLFFLARTEREDVTISSEHDQFQWSAPDDAVQAIEYPRQQDVLRYLQKHQLLK